MNLLQASEGREQASELLLICLDTAQILCLPTSTACRAALQIRMGVAFGTLEPLEISPNTWDLMKSHYSQGKRNNIVKVKKKKKKGRKPELRFCTQIDDDISVWPGIISIISGSPQNCNLRSRVMGWTLQGLLLNWNSRLQDFLALFKFGCRSSALFGDVYAVHVSTSTTSDIRMISLMEESKEELKSFLMQVKEESERTDLRLNNKLR